MPTIRRTALRVTFCALISSAVFLFIWHLSVTNDVSAHQAKTALPHPSIRGADEVFIIRDDTPEDNVEEDKVVEPEPVGELDPTTTATKMSTMIAPPPAYSPAKFKVGGLEDNVEEDKGVEPEPVGELEDPPATATNMSAMVAPPPAYSPAKVKVGGREDNVEEDKVVEPEPVGELDPTTTATNMSLMVAPPPVYSPAKFKVGRRSDFQAYMKRDLLRLGLSETALMGRFDIYWGEQWDVEDKLMPTFMHKDLRGRDNVVVSSIPGLARLIGKKSGLAVKHKRCLRTFSFEDCDFTPFSFNVERRGMSIWMGKKKISVMRDWREVLENQPDTDPLWIVKPQASSDGPSRSYLTKMTKSHIQTEAGVARWLGANLKEGQHSIQKYVSNPVLYEGRKADLRVWAIITSLDPLRVFILNDGFPKVATKKYSSSPAKRKEGVCARPHTHRPVV